MKYLALAIALLLLASCNIVFWKSFKITNATDSEITEIRVTFADHTAERESLPAGKTLRLHPWPTTSGGIDISYIRSGERQEHPLGYGVPEAPMKCEYRIEENATGLDDLIGQCRMGD